MDRKIILGSGIIAVLIVVFVFSFFIQSPKESFEIIHYDKISNFSDSAIIKFLYTPSFSESYWIRYDENVVYVSKYSFNNSEASSNFSKEMLNLFEEQIKIMEEYSFEKYNGYYLSDGNRSSFFLIKDNVLLTFGGENKKTTEMVVKWFIRKFG